MEFKQNEDSLCKGPYSVPETRVRGISIEKNLLNASLPGAVIDPGDQFED